MFCIEKQKKIMKFKHLTVNGTNIEHFSSYINLTSEKIENLMFAIKEKNHSETINSILNISMLVCGSMITVEHYRFELELLEKNNHFEKIYDLAINKPKYLIDANKILNILKNKDYFNKCSDLISKLTQIVFLAAKLDIDLNLAINNLNDNLLTKMIDSDNNVIVKYRHDDKILKPDNFILFDPTYILKNKKTVEALDDFFKLFDK